MKQTILGWVLLAVLPTLVRSSNDACRRSSVATPEEHGEEFDDVDFMQKHAAYRSTHELRNDKNQTADTVPALHNRTTASVPQPLHLHGHAASVLGLQFHSALHSPFGIAACVLVVGLFLLKIMYPQSDAVRALLLGSAYIVTSATMIESNKWLMQKTHYPYPMTVAAGHMFTSFVLANLLRFFCPSAFPSLASVESTWWFRLKFIPIGAAFAISMVCGNAAYQHLSVSFLQIIKECNIALVYAISVLVGMEALRRCSVSILAITLFGAILSVMGEIHFSAFGFMLQLVSSLSEALKIIIQGVLMSGSAKLDPLTMVLFMAPACLLVITVPTLIVDGHHFREIYHQAEIYWPIIAMNAVLAFMLNIVVAQCIKHLSPVGFLLGGIVKDTAIVVTSAAVLGESLSSQQVVGFCVSLTGVGTYSLYKQNIDLFAHDSLMLGFQGLHRRLLCAEQPPAKGDANNAETHSKEQH